MHPRLSRWSDEARRDKRGKPVPSVFGPADLEVCKLLAPTAKARHPWGYQYLPTNYVPLLLRRGPAGAADRLRDLKRKPNSYLQLPEQPKNNSRALIYAIAPKGIDELREEGFEVPRFTHRRLPHELMACLAAASFEYASIKHSDVKIDPVFKGDIDPIIPDWPVFKVTTPYQTRYVFLEADTGSETINTVVDPNATTIGGKFSQYLNLLKSLDKETRRFALFLFVTTRRVRMESMIESLKMTIDKEDAGHHLSANFGFTHMQYDRFINTIPKLTDWAITTDYQRAGLPPFNFLRSDAR